MSTFTCLNDLVLYTFLYLETKKIFSNIYWKIVWVGWGGGFLKIHRKTKSW